MTRAGRLASITMRRMTNSEMLYLAYVFTYITRLFVIIRLAFEFTLSLLF
jgi:hypothetical protein